MAGEFTDYLEADDWKDAAAIVGLIRFFDYAQIPYNKEEIAKARETYEVDSETLLMIPNTTKGWMFSNLTRRISRMRSWTRLLRIIFRKSCTTARQRGRYIKRNGRRRKWTLSTVS